MGKKKISPSIFAMPRLDADSLLQFSTGMTPAEDSATLTRRDLIRFCCCATARCT